MEEFQWIDERIKEIEEVIKHKKSRLRFYKFDTETTESIEMSIDVLNGLIALLEKQKPINKIHDMVDHINADVVV